MSNTEQRAFTPGPWFIWQERAMQDEGLDPEEINDELLMDNEHTVLAGTPIDISRGSVRGCQTIVEVDSFHSDDDSGKEQETALANARLIAAAPDLYEALRELVAAREEPLPPFEAGQPAQEAWAQRGTKAHEAARAALTRATTS